MFSRDRWPYQSMTKLVTHYDNLQVARNASPEVIKAAYRSLSQKHHPDRNPPQQRADCERVMRILNAAYETLSDPDKRREHDRWIAAQEGGAGPRAASRKARSQAAPEPPPWQPQEPAPPGADLEQLGRLQPGRIAWRALPKEAQDYLRSFSNRRDAIATTGERSALARTRTWGTAVLGLLLSAGAWFVLVAMAGGERWSGRAELLFLGWGAFAAVCLALTIAYLVDWIRAPLGYRLLASETFFVHAAGRSIGIWPIHGIEKFHLTTHTRNDAYQHSTLEFKHRGDVPRVFTLYDRDGAFRLHARVAGALTRLSEQPMAVSLRLLANTPLFRQPLPPIDARPAGRLRFYTLAVTAGLGAAIVLHLLVLRPLNARAPVPTKPQGGGLRGHAVPYSGLLNRVE
jgi:hypothetical protein